MSVRQSRVGVRRRLLAIVVLAVAAGLGVSVVAYDLLLDRQLRRQAISLARDEARLARSALRVESGTIDTSAVDPRASLGGPLWVFAGSRAVVRPVGTGPLDDAAAALATAGTGSTRVDETAMLVAVPVDDGGRRVGAVVAAVALAPYERTSHLTLVASLLFAGIVLAGVTVISGWALRRALQPVARMTADAESWSATDLDRRFALGGPDDEITRLGATLDRLLGRVASALRHEQRVTAELSHELRTPLARISAEAELALSRSRSESDYRAALTAIGASADEMREVMETLLLAARAESRLTQDVTDLRDAVEAVAGAHRPGAADRGVSVTVEDGPPVPVAADQALLERLVAPVVENACRYAQASVKIRLEPGPGTVTIAVTDDGPGIRSGEEERIFEPGVRGSAGLEQAEGAGLGLALARRLAQSAGGDVNATAAPGGGHVVVRLPTA